MIHFEKRCVNLDWVELYVLESRERYPMNADYFRNHGYLVREREYGTRQFKEMFSLLDDRGEPFLEVRRNPATQSDKFSGFVPESCHLRLTNRACYYTDAISKLRQFLIEHDYIFKRIFRIDICYDFERFDSGDYPASFARRYMEGKIRKINQSHVSAHAQDNWSAFDYETLSWGNPSSMVTTKLYNKSKELRRAGHDKPYIRYCWFEAGLIDDPYDNSKMSAAGQKYVPDIWRIEFSLKSKVDRWFIIERSDRKKRKKQALEHKLSMFDSSDKLWQRFQDLAYHYFRFKLVKYKEERSGAASRALASVYAHPDRQEVRKDRCPDKILFKFDDNREFLKVSDLPPANSLIHDNRQLIKALHRYSEEHLNPEINKACHVLLDAMRRDEVVRISPFNDARFIEVMQRTIAAKMKMPERDCMEIAAEIQQLLFNDEIF